MLDKELYEYIKLKYKLPEGILPSKEIRIDAMLVAEDHINKINGWVFKGALNLYKNFGYIREGKLTADMDYSLKDLSLDESIEFLIKMISKIEHEIYEFSYTGKKDLTISANGYAGVRVDFLIRNKDGGFNVKFHIDIAIEELSSGFTSFYTIERSIADKFVSMIQRGGANTREKDFIDLKELFTRCDIELLDILISKLIIARKVTESRINWFKENFRSITYVTKHGLEKIIKELNNKI